MAYKTSRNVMRLKYLLDTEDFIFLYSDYDHGMIYKGRDGSNCYWLSLSDSEEIYYGIDAVIDAFLSIENIGYVDPNPEVM